VRGGGFRGWDEKRGGGRKEQKKKSKLNVTTKHKDRIK